MEIEPSRKGEAIPILGIDEAVISHGVDNVSSVKRMSAFGAMFNFACSIIGTSVVATPFAFSLSTPPVGVVYEAIFAFVSWIAAVVLFEVSRDTKCTSFIDLGRRVYNQTRYSVASTFGLVVFPLILLLLSSLLSYIFIASDVFASYLNGFPILAIRAIVAAVIAVLGIGRSFDKLQYISTLTTVLFVVTFGLIMAATFDLMPYLPSNPSKLSPGDMIRAIPILFVGLNGHSSIPGITFEMKPSIASFFYLTSAISLFCVMVLNWIVGYFPAAIFGEATLDDILNQLFRSSAHIYLSTPPTIIAAQVILAIVVIAKAPIVLFPLKEILLDRGDVPVQKRSILAHTVTSFGVMTLCFCLGLIFDNLGNVLSIVGGIGSIMLVTVTPALLHLQFNGYKFLDIRGTTLLIFGMLLLSCNFAAIVLTYLH